MDFIIVRVERSSIFYCTVIESINSQIRITHLNMNRIYRVYFSHIFNLIKYRTIVIRQTDPLCKKWSKTFLYSIIFNFIRSSLGQRFQFVNFKLFPKENVCFRCKIFNSYQTGGYKTKTFKLLIE